MVALLRVFPYLENKFVDELSIIYNRETARYTHTHTLTQTRTHTNTHTGRAISYTEKMKRKLKNF